jgi:hypothetical protein
MTTHPMVGLGVHPGGFDFGRTNPNPPVPSNPITKPFPIIAYGAIILR